MKITMVLDLEIDAGQLAQRLAHQPGLQAGQGIAHLAFQFGLGGQRRHRVDHHNVDAAGTHQRVGDFQRLFAGVGLGDQHFVDVDAQLLGIDRIERMFGVDIGGDAALLLGLGHHVQRQGGLARGFRAVDFDHAAARQAADAERDVEAQRAGRNGIDLRHRLILAQRMTEPLPKARSICARAASSALVLSTEVPSTRRRFACDIGSDPFGMGDAGSAIALSPMYRVCSFALVLFLFAFESGFRLNEVISRFTTGSDGMRGTDE